MNHLKTYNQLNEKKLTPEEQRKLLDPYNEENWIDFDPDYINQNPELFLQHMFNTKEIECHLCKGWGYDEDDYRSCSCCNGSGRIRVPLDYNGPTWSIGGASDISYGT
jgi:hypothetical protein